MTGQPYLYCSSRRWCCSSIVVLGVHSTPVCLSPLSLLIVLSLYSNTGASEHTVREHVYTAACGKIPFDSTHSSCDCYLHDYMVVYQENMQDSFINMALLSLVALCVFKKMSLSLTEVRTIQLNTRSVGVFAKSLLKNDVHELRGIQIYCDEKPMTQ